MTAGDARELVEVTRAPRLGLGSVAAARRGAASDGPLELNFTFRYRDFLFAGRATTGVDHARLQLHANLGHLPYSVESPRRRAEALAILRSARRTLEGRLTVGREHRILLREERRFDEPLTPRLLAATTVRLVLEAKPYLELLAAVVEPPAVR